MYGRIQKIGVFLIIFIISISLLVEGGVIQEYGLVYSGELRLALYIKEGQSILKPDYLLYLQGNPYPGLYLVTYLKPDGELIDRIMLNYTKENLKIQLGDYSLNEMENDFFSFNQDQRGGLIGYQFFNGAIELQILKAFVKGLHYQDKIKGNGSRGPYNLSNSPIIPGSESLYWNGVKLTKEEYQLDYQTGVVFLNRPLLTDEEIEVSYTYQPGGGYYERLQKGFSISLEKGLIHGGVSWIVIEDCPGENVIFYLPARTFQAGILTGEWNGLTWLKLENQLAWSEIRGLLEFRDWAYDGLIRLGNDQTHLKLRYTYHGPEFMSSIDQKETAPLEEYRLEGRWSVNPNLYLLIHFDYSHDNPEKNPELITEYKELRLLKGYWQISPDSYLQFVYQENEEGDDLIFLPEGKEGKIGFLTYSYQGPYSLDLETGFGQWIWKSQSASQLNLNHQFIQLSSRLNWKKERLTGQLGFRSKYIHPINKIENQSEDRVDHFINYDLAYQMGKGQISFSGEEEFKEDYQRHLQEIRIKKRFLNIFQTEFKYQQEKEVYPGADGGLARKISVQIFYQNPIRIEIRCNLSSKGGSAQAFLSGEKGAIKLNWVKDKNGQQVSSQIEYNPVPEFKIISRFIYQKQKELFKKESVWSLVLTGSYQFNRMTKLNFSAELPLTVDGWNDEEYKSEIELIFSL
ncbi:hypothetical protein BBF96_12795 [Anoxybacter fermentans]|uniref:Uncharacterized protein n=1 Tax=Anoxybacter fermentans TaxID=1323375 RepID=A0A3S9T0V5_9FIRM|nr:hypothetical protein [Anoxybacter fermentans]AZR74198.1 hypothetical protein BBF96_12795 [Anoxybacter fermentans]